MPRQDYTRLTAPNKVTNSHYPLTPGGLGLRSHIKGRSTTTVASNTPS